MEEHAERVCSLAQNHVRDPAEYDDIALPGMAVATVLRSHMQFSDAQIAKVFPAAPRATGNVEGLIKV